MNKYEAFIGKVLDGRYKILGLVGVGGMAFVLKAEDLAMNRIVAIKVLNDQYNGDEQAEKRFINESKAVAMLSSKHIVGIYDVAIYPDIKYIVMEFLDGITLKEYMDKKGKLPWKEACNYTLQILRALEHAHSKGVVHRDIKPQNIMLLHNGEIKVTDFGIAKTPNMPAVTITDKAIGTVYYISPEQAGGKETSYASDIYSVGVMLYEMVTGELPFVADSPVTIAMMQINDTPKDPHQLCPDIPVGVSQIILKAMAKSPDDRFTDAHSMLKAIDYVIKNPDVVFADESSKNGRAGKGVIDINMEDNDDLGDDLVASGEKKPKKKKRSRLANKIKEKQSSSLFPVITGVFFAFFIVVLTVGGYMLIKWLPLLFQSDEPNEFYVRDLLGMEYTDALKSELESQSYMVTVKEGYYPGRGFGKIILQDPTSGPKRLTGEICRITLTVNKYPDELTVPDVKYRKASDAERILKKYNLDSTVEYVTDTFANEGQVVRTYPEIGASVDAGRTVTLYVCKGSGTSTAKMMPDVLGLTLDEAIKKLDEAYYKYKIEQVESLKPKNTVVEQSIAPYTTGLEAWTVVTLKISKQSNMTTVPKLTGETFERAQELLSAAGLNLGRKFYDENSSEPVGTVLQQSIEEGTEILTGTEIDITISGKKIVYADAVPDVLGKDFIEAQLEMVQAGYVVKFEYVISDKPENTVINQSIAAGSEGYEEGTEVVLYIAEASNKTTVPELFGMTLVEAEQLLISKNLRLGEVTYDPESPFTPGTVVEQSILAETEVDGETYINITISGADTSASVE